jgi:hypothetical protein
MKQIDWVEEWENRERWVVFSQGGICFGLVMGEEFRNDETVLLVRCKCDMTKSKPQATNFIKPKNIQSEHNSFKEAEDAYNNKFDKK